MTTEKTFRQRAAPTHRIITSGRVYRVPTESVAQGESPRSAGIDREHVRMLANSGEGTLPPILVHSSTMAVIDGFHRLEAARLNRSPVIDVEYFDGSLQEAFLLAVETNVRHGLPLSLQDRKAAARKILSAFPEWSDRAIARRVGLDHKTVGALRNRQPKEAAATGSRIGLDGRSRPLDASEGRLRAQEIIAQNPQASLREVARSAGISVETARDVRTRMQQGDIPRGGKQGGPNTALRPPSQVEVVSALKSLKKDPAVRYSAGGRALVRWLESRLLNTEDAERFLQIPAHQVATVAAMAREVAAQWTEIAHQLENRRDTPR
ncbi:ParB N-terminal domain-containing protein [Streptomyces lusitanus]|uniref:ParB N-terminal domain-containing protein n=1 Tax=Streptomyces lusitanus TaxID=68232 RepID=A0ABU3JUZ4_9ACTN|nr:ParB N-terminal domain-containing protein [Streptomyces lusitanus]